MVDRKLLCGEEQVGVSVDDDGVPGGGAQGGQACPHHPPSSCPGCLHPCCRPGSVLEIPLKTSMQGETLMSMGLFLISLLRVCWPGTDRLSTGSAGTIRPQDWALAPTKSPK